LLTFLIVQIGCAPSVELTKLGSLPRSPQAGELDVYTSAESIDKPYKEIALIKVTQGLFGNKDQTMFNKLILEAKEIGAHGMIILSQEVQYEGGRVQDLGSWTSYTQHKKKVLRASAIVYEEKQ
jgi:hypothetical protein